MPLDLQCVGAKTKVHELEYDWRTLVLYALGIGAKREELDYLYEGRGPKIFPSFAVVPTYAILGELLAISKGPYASVIHGGQSVHMLRPLPPKGTLKTQGTIKGIYDLKLLAQMVMETETTLDGEPVFRTEWQILFRGEGGFGGERRPKEEKVNPPKREPDWVAEDHVSNEQALLYRLSGDFNPLHADPAFAAAVGFEQGPILHGLCTFGFVCRAVTRMACAGDARKITSLSMQFKKPVWPGDTLRTVGYQEGNRVLLQAFAQGRDEAVIGGAYADLGG
ncbi:MAG TPA: MaoC/PaaZ C-terminal domain-containing protein [Polyangiaceae bacterium]|jgi:acyl dehydratase|nr:MaoC/PaaZ C-terminal domain-containing protein [Polyangiaceae bacterium]